MGAVMKYDEECAFKRDDEIKSRILKFCEKKGVKCSNL